MGLATNGTRKRTKRYDANTRIPTDVLPLLEAWLAELPQSPKNDYLREVCLSKFVSDQTDPAITRRTRAMNKWLATERDNSATNDRLLTTDPGYFILPGVRWDRFVDWTCEFISRVIGDTVPLDALIGAFSGGATTSRKRTDGHPALKFVGQADITESAMNWFELVLEECPLWVDLSLQPLRVVNGSSFFTVPKNTLIDRVACKEPDINMFLQKGAGFLIRERLRSFGINLNDQSRNQRLAKLGSHNGSLATLDLSSASDSISSGLVSTFLPPCWHSFLFEVRSPIVEIDGEEHWCEMFSSMGNGFTFELESLLFFAFCKATAYFTGTRGTISVK
nr:MAG: RNA-dependent RNA polymerase [Riboviria sp.]